MTLADMKKNQCATIAQVDGAADFERRFYDMGFVGGQKVVCTNIGISGSPIAYSIRGGKIALRKKDAARIGVTV